MQRAEAAEGAAWLQWEKVATKKQVEKKRRKRRRVDKDESERKSPKNWLMASRRRQSCAWMQSQLRKEQSGRVSSTIGTARKSRLKKKKEVEDWQKEEQMEEQWADEEKAKCDGRSARDRESCRKRGQERACKMMTTKATFAGPRLVKGLQGKC